MRAASARSASGCLRPSRGLQRLRLSSLDSIEIDERAVRADRRRAAPHAALPPLAAGRRRHDPEADEAASQPRRCGSRPSSGSRPFEPDATIGADLIAGFPTETEEMAFNSLKLLDDCDIVAAHVFPFSPRPSTPAARMPQLAARDREGPCCASSRGCRADGVALARESGRHEPAGARSRAAARGTPTISRRSRSKVRAAAKPASRRITGRDGRSSDGGLGMSWLDRLRGGFQKTAERVADNLTGLTSRAALDTSTLDDIEEALIASDLGPEASHRIREAIAAPEVRAPRRARPPLDPCRGDREDLSSGRQAAGNMGFSAPARDPGDRRQRLGQDDDDRQARPLAEGAGLWRPARCRRHLPRRRDRAAADLGRAHRRARDLRQGRRRCRRHRVRRREAGDRAPAKTC